MKLILEDSTKICGIYKITNLVNGKFYIGSTNNIKSRYKSHFNDLKSNKHTNGHLQNAYNSYGCDAFQMELIFYIFNESDLLSIEQSFINEHWDNQINCYNMAKSASSPMKGRKASNETKLLMSKNRKESWDNNPKRKELFKEIFSGKNNPYYGKTHNLETRQLISKAKKGKPAPKGKDSTSSKTWYVDLYNDKTGEIIYGPIIGGNELARKLNLHKETLRNLLNGISLSYKNWRLLKNKDLDITKQSNEKKKKIFNISFINKTNNEIIRGPFFGIDEMKNKLKVGKSSVSFIMSGRCNIKGWKVLEEQK